MVQNVIELECRKLVHTCNTHFIYVLFILHYYQRCPGLGFESRFLGLGLETCGLELGLGLDTSGLKLDFEGIFTF